MAKDILIQKLSGSDTTIHSLGEWGIVVNELPLKRFSEAKNIPSNDWYDENGEEEYLPEKLFLKAYEIDVKMSMSSNSMATLNTNLSNFFDYLISNGEFSLYNPNTGIGRTKVRYAGYSDTAEYHCGHSKDGSQHLIQFTIKMKVNDPTTNTVLNV